MTRSAGVSATGSPGPGYGIPLRTGTSTVAGFTARPFQSWNRTVSLA